MRELVTTPLRSLGSAFEEVFVADDAASLIYADRKVRYPWQYGAVGDGTTDDTTALQAWIDDCLSSGDATAVARQGIAIADGGCASYAGTGTRVYKITAPLVVRSVEFFTLRNLTLRYSGAMATVLDLDGVAYSTFVDILIRGDGGYGSSTDTATNVVYYHWGSGTYRSCTQNSFRNVRVLSGKFVNGFAIGTDNANQVDNTTYYHCNATGSWSSGETTWWQYGCKIGNGSAGNNLQHNFYMPVAVNVRYGIANLASQVAVFAAGFGGNEVDLYNAGTSYFTVRGARSEDSERLFQTGGPSGSVAFVSLDDITWAANGIATDGRWIDMQLAGLLRLGAIYLSDTPAYTPVINCNAGDDLIVEVDGLATTAAWASSWRVNSANTHVVSRGFYQHAGGAVTQNQSGLRLTGTVEWFGWSGLAALDPDTNLYRNAANVLKTDDKLLAALGIGVGNSAAGSTLGTVTKKIEVFDASGASLGFLPVYDAIT